MIYKYIEYNIKFKAMKSSYFQSRKHLFDTMHWLCTSVAYMQKELHISYEVKIST